MKILEVIMNDHQFIENYFKTKNYNLISPIISVMARHMYDSSTVLKVLSSGEEKHEEKEALDEKLEADIDTLGAKLLEILVDVNDLKKIIKQVIYF